MKLTPLSLFTPEREPAAEDAEEPLEGRLPHGARQAAGQLPAGGEGAEEEPGTAVYNVQQQHHESNYGLLLHVTTMTGKDVCKIAQLPLDSPAAFLF